MITPTFPTPTPTFPPLSGETSIHAGFPTSPPPPPTYRWREWWGVRDVPTCDRRLAATLRRHPATPATPAKEWMALAMREGGGTEHPHSILAGQSGRGRQRIDERAATGSGRTEAIGNRASRRVWRNHAPRDGLYRRGIAAVESPIPTALPTIYRKKQAIG